MEPSHPPAQPRTRGLLLVIVGAVTVLCVVFGVTVVRQQSDYQAYKEATLERQGKPWVHASMTLEECVAYTVDWGMGCPGVGSWCSNEAPQLTLECLTHGDRHQVCEALGDAVASTQFGYHECERMRASVQGRYAKRNHKKFCAASYRAVAEFCRQTLGPPPN